MVDDQEEIFFTILNKSMTFLAPYERKAVNEVLRLCGDYQIPFAEAVDLAFEDSEALPMDLTFSIRRANEMGCWAKIDGFFKKLASEWRDKYA